MNEQEHEQLSALISALTERDALRAEVGRLREEAKRIEKERDEARGWVNTWASGNTYVQAIRKALGVSEDASLLAEARHIRRLLKAAVGETIQEAVERVVAERDNTLMHLSAARDLSDNAQERAEAALKLRDEAVRERDALRTLPQDMAKALGIASHLPPEQTIETCKHFLEQYTKICESRRALLDLRDSITRTLSLSPTATKDEVIAECVALVRSQEISQERAAKSMKDGNHEVIEYLKKGVAVMQEEIRDARFASDRKTAMLIRKLSAAAKAQKS